ncbi:hypothetical protein ACWF0M_31710 [Kribbella sp. NPDC055110]
MSTTELDELLDRMPRIAEVVEKFSSESIQSEVFRALMDAFGVAAGMISEADADPGAFAVDLQSPVGSADTEPVNGAPAPVKKSPTKKTSGSKAKQTRPST